MKLITLLVVIAGVIALAQLAKVGQLTSLIRNKREEDISAADTRLNGEMFVAFMVAFYASFIWLIIRYGDYSPPAASAHGETYDTLMNFNMYIIMAVFFLVNTVLFVFANKYRQKQVARPSSSPTTTVWAHLDGHSFDCPRSHHHLRSPHLERDDRRSIGRRLRVELYSKQFDWTARYPGADGEFGLANYNLITPATPWAL